MSIPKKLQALLDAEKNALNKKLAKPFMTASKKVLLLRFASSFVPEVYIGESSSYEGSSAMKQMDLLGAVKISNKCLDRTGGTLCFEANPSPRRAIARHPKVLRPALYRVKIISVLTGLHLNFLFFMTESHE